MNQPINMYVTGSTLFITSSGPAIGNMVIDVPLTASFFSGGSPGTPGSGDADASYVLTSATASLPNGQVLTAGPNITINSGGGLISITGSAGSGTGDGDSSATYLVLSNTASLSNERSLVVSTGILSNDDGAGSTYTLSIDDNTVATLSGSLFSGPVVAAGGISGSFTRTSTGDHAFIAGQYITINTNSLGQVEITGSAPGSGTADVDWTDVGHEIYTTSSVAIGINDTASSQGSDTVFFVSGAIDGNEKAVFGGDVVMSGTLSLSGGISSSNELVFTDSQNASGPTLTSLASKPHSFYLNSGLKTSNTSGPSDKESFGGFYFDPTFLTPHSGRPSYFWRVTAKTSESPVGVAVDLFDQDGVMNGLAEIVTSSIMSSSATSYVKLEKDLTMKFYDIADPGVFEARMWRTVSGSVTSSISLIEAKLDVEYNASASLLDNIMTATGYHWNESGSYFVLNENPDVTSGSLTGIFTQATSVFDYFDFAKDKTLRVVLNESIDYAYEYDVETEIATAVNDLTDIFGVEPSVFLHADDLTEADGVAVTTWQGRTTFSGSGFNSPTMDVDGYDGSRAALNNTTVSHLNVDGAASSFGTPDTPFTVIMAVNLPTAGGEKTPFGLGSSISTSPYLASYYFGSNTPLFRTHVVNGTCAAPFVFDTPSIIAFTYDGANLSIFVRSSTGDTTIADNIAFAPTGTAYNTFRIGVLARSTNIWPAAMKTRCVIAAPGTSVTQAKLIEAMDFIEQELDCPV